MAGAGGVIGCFVIFSRSLEISGTGLTLTVASVFVMGCNSCICLQFMASYFCVAGMPENEERILGYFIDSNGNVFPLCEDNTNPWNGVHYGEFLDPVTGETIAVVENGELIGDDNNET